jgi:hypothetical protein
MDIAHGFTQLKQSGAVQIIEQACMDRRPTNIFGVSGEIGGSPDPLPALTGTRERRDHIPETVKSARRTGLVGEGLSTSRMRCRNEAIPLMTCISEFLHVAAAQH